MSHNPRNIPAPHRFSASMRRATISFTDPDEGRSTHQENEGCVDERLRAGIRAAKKAFYAEFYRKDVPGGAK